MTESYGQMRLSHVSNYRLIQKASSSSLSSSSTISPTATGTCTSLKQAIYGITGTRGHTEEIAAITVSPDANYIVSCSMDSSVRVWRYMSFDRRREEDGVYVIHAVAYHSSDVLAVAIVGNGGPLVSGTANGGFSVLSLDQDPQQCFKRQKSQVVGCPGDAITNLCTYQAQANEEDFFLAIATGDEQSSDEESSDEQSSQYMVAVYTVSIDPHQEDNFLLNRLCEIKHEEQALGVKFVPRSGDPQDMCLVATLGTDIVRLWSLQGEPFASLQAPEVEELEGLVSMDVSRDGRMLVAGGSAMICRWDVPFQHGSKPAVEYDAPGVSAVGLDPAARWAIDLTHNDSVCAWPLKAENGQEFTGEDGSPHMHVHPEVLAEAHHSANEGCVKMCVANLPDNADHVTVVTGGGGIVKMFDMHGETEGECIAELRSMSLGMIYKPFILMFVDFVQVSALAFSMEVPWHWRTRRAVQPTVSIALIEVGSIHIDKTDIEVSVAVAREAFHWYKLQTMLCFMALFVLFALLDAYHRLNRLLREVRKMETKHIELDDTSCLGHCMCMIRTVLHIVRGAVWIFMLMCSTILMIPIAKVGAAELRCLWLYVSHIDEDLQYEGHEKCAVSKHLTLSVVGIALFLVFMALLPAYALVDGDSSYFQLRSLLSYRAILINTRRKTNAVYLGRAQKRSPFRTNLVQFTKKLLFVFLAELMGPELMKIRLVLTAILCAIMLRAYIKNRVMHDASWQVMWCGLTLLQVFVYSCSAWTAFVDDVHYAAPTWALIFSCGLVLTGILFLFFYWRDIDVEEKAIHKVIKDVG